MPRKRRFCEITDEEIEGLWNREAPDQEEVVRMNGKYVWDVAKRACDFIHTHGGRIDIIVLRKQMRDEEGHESDQRGAQRGKEETTVGNEKED